MWSSCRWRLAYDRVLEDRVLVEAATTGVRRFRARPLAILAFIWRMGWRLVRGRFAGFGSAAVAFGAPLSLRGMMAERPGRAPEALTERLGARLMAAVADCVPVLPVPLVAAAGGRWAAGARSALAGRVAAIIDRLAEDGAALELPEGGPGVVAEQALAVLGRRGTWCEEVDGMLRPVAQNAGLLAFYAGAVQQRLERAALPEGVAVARVETDAATPQT